MKRKQLFFSLLLSLFALARGEAQFALVCNDMVTVTLDSDCSYTISHEEILEGSFCQTCDYVVEIDKTPPPGNGPWVPATLTSADLGKTYAVRVKEVSSGNICWGLVNIAEEVECTGVTQVELDANGQATLLPADLNINFLGNCLPVDPGVTTMNNGQSSVSYDCSDLGVHILQVTAGDQSGVFDSCYTTVVVSDPAQACDTCLSCPPAATVSFETGGSDLLPAWQSGDWAAFDAYGSSFYSSDCAFADSTYSIEYHTSPHGQNWFVRRWEGLDGSGTTLSSCEQVITFPFFQTINVSGIVFLDTILNCTHDTGEPGITIFKVIATKWPSNEQIVVTPAADGSFSFDVNINGLDSMIQVRYNLPQGLSSNCPTAFLIPATTTQQQHNFEIALQSESDCPLMEVNIGSTLIRRCVENTFYIQYCNQGLAPAEDAYVTLQLDPLFQPLSSSIPWSALDTASNTYTFPLGDVPLLSCASFSVVALLDCAANVGQTLCADATIFPHDPCGLAVWDGPFVETTAYCDGDTVKLAVWNTGNADMTEERQYIVIEDVIMYRQGKFMLGAGDSITVKMPANGSTWRIEAEQIPAYPLRDEPSAAIEACGGLNTPGLLNAFPQNDREPYYDHYCEEVVASCDPNDKTATPAGYGPDYTIRNNTDIEYRLRFQNTGNDTAFRVVIVDTLPVELDPKTIEAGASSHPYRLDVYPGGILHFVFDPIQLPDSTTNEPASRGFVKFRIAQQPDLPAGTVIANDVAIYFDFNEPVITNTAWHTIGKPFVTVDVDAPLDPGLSVEVMPNPFGDRATIRLEGREIGKGMFTLIDAQGRSVRNQQFTGNQFQVERNDLKAGLYFFRIDSEGRTVARGKMQVF